MKNGVWAFLLALSFFPGLLRAQDSSSTSTQLTDQQKEGRRIFVQRCSICHTQPNIASKRYGPALNKDLVEGNEDFIRNFIMNGQAGQMPGFKYGLERSEINDIIAYLETVPPQKPMKSGAAGE